MFKMHSHDESMNSCAREKLDSESPARLLNFLYSSESLVICFWSVWDGVAVNQRRCSLGAPTELTDLHIECEDPILDVPPDEIIALITFVHGEFTLCQRQQEIQHRRTTFNVEHDRRCTDVRINILSMDILTEMLQRGIIIPLGNLPHVLEPFIYYLLRQHDDLVIWEWGGVGHVTILGGSHDDDV